MPAQSRAEGRLRGKRLRVEVLLAGTTVPEPLPVHDLVEADLWSQLPADLPARRHSCRAVLFTTLRRGLWYMLNVHLYDPRATPWFLFHTASSAFYYMPVSLVPSILDAIPICV
jgi:hypothetical protein